MSFLLDTNLISELMKPVPNPKVLAWLNQQSDLYISAITQAELLYGVLRMPDGKRKNGYLTQLNIMFDIDFKNKILPFHHSNAVLYADLTCHRENIGKPIDMADAQIASIALACQFTLVTRNSKDFVNIQGLQLFNPFEL